MTHTYGATLFKTEEEIVEDLFYFMEEEDKKFLSTISKSEMIRFHFSNGMAIRNEYGLWDSEHPLTKQWHQDEANDCNKYIGTNGISGTDCHPNHPDAVSMDILYMLWDKCNETSKKKRSESS